MNVLNTVCDVIVLVALVVAVTTTFLISRIRHRIFHRNGRRDNRLKICPHCTLEMIEVSRYRDR